MLRLPQSVLILLLTCHNLCTAFQVGNDDRNRLSKETVDDNSKYTKVGNIALTVTNFGMLGHGFTLWPRQPSCEYPAGSGIENLWGAGLWVGGIKEGRISVSTGADLPLGVSSFRSISAGFEMTPALESRTAERSTLTDSPVFRLDAISHQDFIADYTDTNKIVPGTTSTIPEHLFPLGIGIHQESYAWNFPFADAFVILNYTIKNISNTPIDSVYVGLWADPVVRNTNRTPPTVGSPFFTHAGNGYVDSLRMQYTFDYDGDPGFTNGYIGIKFLGSTPSTFSPVGDTLPGIYNAWIFHGTTGDVTYQTPRNDEDRYQRLKTPFTQAQINSIPRPGNILTLLSTGPFPRLLPGDSINVVFAVICAKKAGTADQRLDLPEQRANLYTNAFWAQRAYNAGYILPSPPSPPRVRIVPSNQHVSIYWDNSSESSVDPFSGKKDFEGYRLYGTPTGADLSQQQDILSSLLLLGDFDRPDDDIGYNTGFGKIKLSQPVTFPGDPIQYTYRFEVPSLLNGWQYIFTVTAYDQGDPESGLPSFESSLIQNLRYVVPGTTPTSDASTPIGVYPNPYYAHAYWDGRSERERKIYFYNLPSDCEIRIYTLAGDIVASFEHHGSTYNANDIQWFQTFSRGSQTLAGGEHAWDLITQSDQAIATGLYLFTVRDQATGEIKRGKFLVVK